MTTLIAGGTGLSGDGSSRSWRSATKRSSAWTSIRTDSALMDYTQSHKLVE
jgi:hypothetical protein